ncbi:hypothetical protein SAMN05216494_0058 [Streptococcus sp. NLAE-zl-C503]|uniref:hypothetical protein n=1 Tax=Streptococcus sp. NLAE-zl-C503 TaxID=1855327 RepID=UPI0008807F76|nr:hypothetical protein [Streptococcus sp. NLAE-zl-C503]SDP69672.1 hypothetical protein SAMN05216494_0058 [Streptococcus sp. NLAE-zl-C503]DAY28333.1 MAG TPA: hypothetical protein [Caudoviricetes sp.]
MDENKIIKLKDVEFVGIGNFEGETVFFDKKTDKMFLGHSKTKFKVSPIAFSTGVALILYVIVREITKVQVFSGFWPLTFGFFLMIIISKLLYRPALNEELVISPFVLSNIDMITFLKKEKKNIVKSHLIILLAFLFPVLFSTVYLLTSNFLFLFLAILFFMFPLLLLNTKPIQRFKVVHMLDKKYSTKEKDS